MLFLYKDDIDDYRYAVGKLCFLRINREFQLSKNYMHSNCMRVMDQDNQEIIISLFQRPKNGAELDKKIPFRVYYQQAGYTKAKNSGNPIENSFLLDEEFDELYDKTFEIAIKDPESLLKIEADNLDILFEKLLHENVESGRENSTCFKYYAKDTIRDKKYNVVDGRISFSDPNRFNDPFDVNCFFCIWGRYE